jgi:acetate CoA/acetoacetate CoA-transferase beta subunit
MKERLDRNGIAGRIAKELKDGQCVNLGFGIPIMVSSYIPSEMTIFFHAEQGLVGYGRILTADEVDKMDYDLINAGGQFVTSSPGMCIVDHVVSFTIVRGGRMDVAILGALQVSEEGDLANWTRSHDIRQGGISIGGAMDLAVGAKKVIIAMEHVTKDGEPKIVKKCSYPLTGKRCVNLIVTDAAVIEVTREGLLLKEIMPRWTVEEVQAITEPKLEISRGLKEIEI